MAYRVNHTTINEIPIIECYPEEAKSIKGVFFIVHGHTCSKELYYFGKLPERLTNLGFLVVSIDAYKHGLRMEEPYQSGQDYEKTMAMPEVIKKTAIDLSNLYLNHYIDFAGKLGFLGISMGGHIVYQMPKYLHKIDFLIPLIGAPDLKRHYQDMKASFLGQARMNELSSILVELENSDSIYDPSSKMLIIEGTQDNVVTYKNAYDFYTRMHDSGHLNIHYKDFPVGHTVTEEMEQTIEDFIRENI